jgi:anti-sigma regulatory factor (Ser/Thr protein kinase)
VAPPPRALRDFGASIWFELSVGHTGRAEARWLLPKICEAGGITNESIGAIRVRETLSYVQIATDQAARFGARTEIEPGLTMRRMESEPPVPGTPGAQPARPKAQAKKVVLEVIDPEQTLPPLYGNSRIIRRAICECIDNAITHSRREVNSQQNLEVRIQYFLTGEHVLITVRNQGAIPEDKGIEVREAFAPASAPGNGRLGLPLVNRIVGLHGGNMRITSSVEDEVRVMLEFPTGAPQRGHDRLDLAQVQRYATDLAQLMSRRRKEPV